MKKTRSFYVLLPAVAMRLITCLSICVLIQTTTPLSTSRTSRTTISKNKR